MKILLCVVLSFVIFTSGCCSIFTSDPQTISVDSKPAGANVKIGPYSGQTPYNVPIPRGKNYIITAEYQGKKEMLSLEKQIEPVYFVNILFWPGLIIDLATGSMFRYEPAEYDFDFSEPAN
jgi:hypothetical protein